MPDSKDRVTEEELEAALHRMADLTVRAAIIEGYNTMHELCEALAAFSARRMAIARAEDAARHDRRN